MTARTRSRPAAPAARARSARQAPGAAPAPGGAPPSPGDRPVLTRPFGELAPGDRFATAARTVRERDIRDFACLTGDRHPLHVDPAWAAGSRFGEQVAHGLLVLSFAVGLVPLDPGRVVALRRVDDAVFKQPVKIGDSVHVEGKIVGTRELDDEHGLVELRLRILGGDGRLVARVTVELLWRR